MLLSSHLLREAMNTMWVSSGVALYAQRGANSLPAETKCESHPRRSLWRLSPTFGPSSFERAERGVSNPHPVDAWAWSGPALHIVVHGRFGEVGSFS